jgi:SPP1 gp7 family putative phage head morphogenesis protein
VQKNLPQLAQDEALAWLDDLGQSIKVQDQLPHGLLLEIATEEGYTAEEEAKLHAANMALQMILDMKSAVDTGAIPAKWQRDDGAGLIAEGLARYDPRLTFQNGLRAAYQAGTYERAMKSDSLTHLVFRTMEDGRVRPEHDDLDGTTLPKDDPWWDTHCPPIDYNCRCRAYPLDSKGIEKLQSAGKKVRLTAPDEEQVTYTNPDTGEKRTLPASVGATFGFGPLQDKDRIAALLTDRIAAIGNID